MAATNLTPGAEDESGTGSVGALNRPSPPPSPPITKKRLKKSAKAALIVIAVVSLLEILAFSGTYFLYSRKYVTTDNAQVDGDQIHIISPTAGTVTDWSISEGSTVRKNQIVGRIQSVGSGAQSKRTVQSPGTGTIAITTEVEGQYVTAGTTLATAYDPNAIYITARVEENDIGDVHPGQQVNISVDAYPDTPVLGIVTQIQGAAAGEFSPWPSPDTDPTNPQKVDQYIPVKISIINSNEARLVPGMSVAAHIRR
jgi:multidrug resistance efflux pump